MTYTEFNKQVSEILQQSVHADGVLNLFEKDSVEISCSMRRSSRRSPA